MYPRSLIRSSQRDKLPIAGQQFRRGQGGVRQGQTQRDRRFQVCSRGKGRGCGAGTHTERDCQLPVSYWFVPQYILCREVYTANRIVQWETRIVTCLPANIKLNTCTSVFSHELFITQFLSFLLWLIMCQVDFVNRQQRDKSLCVHKVVVVMGSLLVYRASLSAITQNWWLVHWRQCRASACQPLITRSKLHTAANVAINTLFMD